MNALDSKIVPKTLVARPPRALISSTAHLLKRLGFKVKERSVDAFEGSGVTPMHYGVLVLLDEDPRETQATIADALGYDRSHLVGLLDELEEAAIRCAAKGGRSLVGRGHSWTNGWPAGGAFRRTRAGNAWRGALRSGSRALPPSPDSRFE